LRIYIGNIAYGSGPSELRAFLDELIPGKTLSLIWPRDNNGLRPFCFVDVPDGEEEMIISTLHNQEFNGRRLNVSSARPKRVV
jgi:RNA recognition motif-containing protein